MRTRGRVSAAHIEAETREVVTVEFGGKRPQPPAELNERQAAIWRETTLGEPVGFFNSGATLALLTDYCRHRDTSERLTVMIEAMDATILATREGLNRQATLLRMRELETRAAGNMATKLRLTNQSRFRSEKADKLAEMNPKRMPWE